MKRLVPLALILATPMVLAVHFTTPTSGAAPLPAGEGGGDGKAVFLAQKCELCHSVSTAGIESKAKSEKMKGPDLVGAVTAEHTAEWIGKYLKKEADLDGKKHAKGFTGTDEELRALVDWLALQKK